MARTRFLSLTSLALFAISTGCVSQEKYNAQRLRADQYAEQLAAAQSQVNSATAQNEVFKSQMERARGSQDNQGALIVNQAATITELTRQLEEMNGKYKMAMDGIARAGTGPLPAALTNELNTFAAANPGTVDFDEARGVVKFKSDVTFSAGSAVVKPEAKSVIDQFAGILNGPVASQYDLMVVGHTDSQQVSNPATIKAGHLDNWYLSAHRAIAVSKVLQGQGIRAARMQIAGYADQRPVAPNDSDANKAKNRRVEVLILPTTSHSAPPQPAVAAQSPARNEQPKRSAAPANKDTPPSTISEIDRSGLNK